MSSYQNLDMARKRRADILASCRRFGFDDVRVVVDDDSSAPPTLLLNARAGTGLLALCALEDILTAILQHEPRIVLRGSLSAETLSGRAVLL